MRQHSWNWNWSSYHDGSATCQRCQAKTKIAHGYGKKGGNVRVYQRASEDGYMDWTPTRPPCETKS